MKRYIQNLSILVLMICSSFVLAGPAFGQTLTVSLQNSRSFPQHFFGANGQMRGPSPWDQSVEWTSNTTSIPCTGPSGLCDSKLGPALGGLNYGTLRFPAGTQANWWDWETGDVNLHYANQSDAYPLYRSESVPLPGELTSEVGRELASAGSETVLDYNLNVLTDPTCMDALPVGCPYNSGIPNMAYQESLLEGLSTNGTPAKFIELGNELSGGSATCPIGGSNPYTCVYADGQAYITKMNTWITAIRGDARIHPTPNIAVTISRCNVYNDCPAATTNPHQSTWTDDVLTYATAGSLPDAVILHEYGDVGTTLADCPTGGCLPGFINNVNVATMFAVPYNQVGKYDIYFNNTTDPMKWHATGTKPNVWITENNIDGCYGGDSTDSCNPPDANATGHYIGGTWSSGLYLATYSLLWANEQKVTLALHHETQAATPTFPDIWSENSSTAFTKWGLPITPKPDGYTAQGLTTTMVDTAALGQSVAEQLNFGTGAPTLSGTSVPALYGEIFGSSSQTAQIIILNLDNADHSVKLSGFVHSASFYEQIYGPYVGAYVDGNIITSGGATTGFEAYTASGCGSMSGCSITAEPLTYTSSSSPSITSLKLKAFSITRVIVTLPGSTGL